MTHPPAADDFQQRPWSQPFVFSRQPRELRLNLVGSLGMYLKTAEN